MRKLLAVMLSLTLLLGAFSAAMAGGQTYMGENGHLYQGETVLLEQPVEQIICETETAVYLLCAGETEQELLRVDLTDGSAKMLAQVAAAGEYAYVAAEASVYYLDAADPARLMRLDLNTDEAVFLGTLKCADGYLQATLAGARILSVSDASINMVYSLEKGMAECDIPAGEYRCFDTVEVLGTEEYGLLLRTAGESEWQTVAERDAAPVCEYEGKLIYESWSAGGHNVLCVYDPQVGASQILTVLEGEYLSASAVLAGKLYRVKTSGEVETVDLETGAVEIVTSYGEVTDARLAVAGEQVHLYTVSEDGVNYRGVVEYTEIVAEPTEEKAEEPVYTLLAKGSKGEKVLSLQQQLSALGYPVGTVDGDFGEKTANAIRYLQSQMWLAETGEADPALQEMLFTGRAPAYNMYMQLESGMVGIRVVDLQSRLSALGYFANAIDGEFGPHGGSYCRTHCCPHD